MGSDGSYNLVLSSDDAGSCEKWNTPAVTDIKLIDKIGPITNQQLETLKKEAYQEGFNQGQREGYAAGQQTLQQHAEQFKQLMIGMVGPWGKFDQEVEQQILLLVKTVTKHLLQAEITQSDDYIISLVKQIMDVLPFSTRETHLILHPADAEIVRNAELIEPNKAGWRILEDQSVARGGCRVETATIEVDATLEQQINEIVKQLEQQTSQEEDDGSA